MDRLFLGPAYFSYAGWGEVSLDESSRLEPGPGFLLRYVHRRSFEADVWLEQGLSSTFPVCVMNAGYSSGWTSEVFGLPLSAVEVRCRAMGHDACRFVMAPPTELPAVLAEYEALPSPDGNGRAPWRIPDPFLRQRMERQLLLSQEALERRVRERTEELSRLAGRLQDEILERERAEQRAVEAARWEAAVQVAGGISHDFNNLMGVVIGELERLETRLPSPGPETETLARIRAGIQAASGLSMHLLDFVSPGTATPSTVEASRGIREVLSLLERLFPPSIRLQVQIPDGLGAVSLDPDGLTRVLTHLLLHLRTRLSRGGSVLVRAARVPETGVPEAVVLEVEPVGIDASPEAVEPTREPGRTHLGLAAARHLLEASGGRLSVEALPDGGIRFRAWLPAAPVRLSEQSPSPRQTPGGQGEVLLVVEDHLALQRLLHEVLVQAGYQVLSTADPQEALRWVEDPDQRLDLLLTDVILPGIHGRALAEAALSHRPSLKVLFMSGYPDDHLGRTGLPMEGLELLQKPFSPSVLLEHLHRLLRGS